MGRVGGGGVNNGFIAPLIPEIPGDHGYRRGRSRIDLLVSRPDIILTEGRKQFSINIRSELLYPR